MLMGAATSRAQAEPLQVLGQAGVLGEWELTANLDATDAARKAFSGPMLMRHVGLCTQDGPEEKKGELKLQLTRASRLEATLVVEGVTCTYQGRKSDSYSGVLRCPNQRDVMLRLWLK